MPLSRRLAIQASVGALASTAVGRFPANAATETTVQDTRQPGPPVRPDSCWVNLNRPQRYAFMKQADLVGRTRFPVLDTRQVHDAREIELIFHEAEKHDGPVLTADPRLESGVSLYGSVHVDGDRLRMWYQPSQADNPGNPYDVAYAESQDGIHWDRPELGLVQRRGTRKNNLVNFYGHGPSVMDLGPDPERGFRYVAIAVGWPPKLKIPALTSDPRTRRLSSYWAYHSQDGLRWQLFPVPRCAVLPNMSDTAAFIHDPYRDRLLGSVKLEPRIGLFDRRSITISTARTSDPTTWDPCRLALFPDELDDQMAQDRGARFAEFYGMGLLAQRDLLFGFLEVYQPTGDQHPSQAPGVRLGYHGKAEVQLAYSYDGFAWQRSRPRDPLIPVGKTGEWDDGFLTAQSSIIEWRDHVWIYYSGYRLGHSNVGGPGGALRRKIGLARVKRDRFASFYARHNGLVDIYHGRPEGRRLLINSRSKGQGGVRVEVLENDKVLAGFSRDDCRVLAGDHLRQEVRWGDRSWKDIPRNKVIRLRFLINDCHLFAYELQS